MWNVSGTRLRMSEHDFGIGLPVTVHGAELTAVDSLRFTFKKNQNAPAILVKDFDEIVDNTVQLEFTEEESALFAPGSYVYALDWYQNDAFMCNIVEVGSFIVGDKA